MKSLVIYDSLYGNTAHIARSIHASLGAQTDSSLLHVADYHPEVLSGVELFVVGSPTQGFKPTDKVKQFLKSIPAGQLKGIRVAAFDTRFTQGNIDSTPVLPFFVKLFGFAAEPIARELQKKGGELALPAEGFFVTDKEGSLLEGELERAAAWAGILLT